jgi:hypothetical protein
VTVLGRVGPASALALWVDPKVHADEVARFRSKIVAGPGDGDCSIWISLPAWNSMVATVSSAVAWSCTLHHHCTRLGPWSYDPRSGWSFDGALDSLFIGELLTGRHQRGERHHHILDLENMMG